ncbi:FUSC family protein [Streptomyces sp. NPDC005706]|uniref:FUSC family protein n=1 Tax=Streptomyces sp. NPDC005706 TaxID=3157169 RepID=UPI0033D073C7
MAFLDAALVPMVVFWTIGHEEYLLSALFSLLFAALGDPGGSYGHRALHITLFALIGAVAAALLLWVPAGEHGLKVFAVQRGLEMVALVLLMHGAGIRFWNYTLYSAAVAAGVLILVDLPQRSDNTAEGYRVLWTLCGVGIGLAVMLPAGLLAKRTAKTSPQRA